MFCIYLNLHNAKVGLLRKVFCINLSYNHMTFDICMYVHTYIICVEHFKTTSIVIMYIFFFIFFFFFIISNNFICAPRCTDCWVLQFFLIFLYICMYEYLFLNRICVGIHKFYGKRKKNITICYVIKVFFEKRKLFVNFFKVNLGIRN